MDLVAPGFSSVEAITVALFVAVAWWEHARPGYRPAVPAGPRWFANLALLAIRKGVSASIAPLLAAAATTALLPTILPEPATAVGAALHLVAIMLALDLGYYLAHRLLHASSWLWRFHAVHHTDLDLDVTTTFRGHPVEAVAMGLLLAGIAGMLGASPAEAASYAVLVMAVQLVAHANLRFPPRIAAWLEALIVTPGFHRLHHSRDERECHANFGAVLVLWDRLFGTAVASAGRSPAEFGVADYLDLRFQRLGGMLLQPALVPRRPMASIDRAR